MVIENKKLISISNNDIINGECIVPKGVETIENYVFEQCENLTSVALPDGLKTIGSYAFYRCKNLKSINLPDGIEAIKYGTFNSCESLTSIVLPKGLKYMGTNAFSHCKNLTSIILPESLKSIRNSAFACCINLSNINFPKSLKRIEDFAFYNCDIPAYSNKGEIIDLALTLLPNKDGLCTCLDEATRKISLKKKVLISVTSTFPNFNRNIAIENFGGRNEGYWWDKNDKEIRKKVLEYLRS